VPLPQGPQTSAGATFNLSLFEKQQVFYSTNEISSLKRHQSREHNTLRLRFILLKCCWKTIFTADWKCKFINLAFCGFSANHQPVQKQFINAQNKNDN
jgi:hypothetical protein